MKIFISKYFDLLGISSASLCLIHCLVFPLLAIIPFGISHDVYVDLVFALLGLLAVYKIQTDGSVKNMTKSVLWVSIGLVLLSVVLDLFFHIHSILIYIGAVGLIAGHILNFRYYLKSNTPCNKMEK